MTTYSDLVNRILRVLDDVDQAKFDDDLIHDGVCAAHDAILTWVPNLGKAIITSGSSGDYLLPDDCYVVDAVQITSSGLFIQKSLLYSGTVRGSSGIGQPDWSDYPRGYITLSSVESTSDITVYYRAVWPKPISSSDTSFVVRPPAYCHNGIVYYASAHCLIPETVSSANLNQFKMRPEQGSPVDNPLEIMADMLMKRFYAEMKMMPPFVRSGG